MAVRIGIVGCGLIGVEHLSLVARSDDAVIAGIADPSPGVQHLAERFATQCYPDIHELLSDETPDAVI
ncbi:MAG: Gfo/Idh/MocA family oxidoreductase, partial [Pseudomonadota bacterium]